MSVSSNNTGAEGTKSPVTLRNAVLFMACASYFVIGIIHPEDLEVGDATGLYIGIHVVQLFSIWGIALGLWFLTEGIENRAAQIARWAILPYAIFYSAFDAVAGIAIGIIVQEANSMNALDRETLARFLDSIDPPLLYALYFASGLTWLIVAGAASLSLRGQVHSGAIGLMVMGAAIFAVGHPFPPGPIGIGLFVAGLTWFHLTRRSGTDQRQVDVVPAVAPTA